MVLFIWRKMPLCLEDTGITASFSGVPAKMKSKKTRFINRHDEFTEGNSANETGFNQYPHRVESDVSLQSCINLFMLLSARRRCLKTRSRYILNRWDFQIAQRSRGRTGDNKWLLSCPSPKKRQQKSRLKSGLENHGGAKETRTLDPHTASVML